MAELETPAQPPRQGSAPAWTSAQTRTQFTAIAWLRWRITANSLARRGGAGELAGRASTAMIFFLFLFLCVLGAGLVGFLCVSQGHMERIAWLLWGIFLLCQLLNIQLGQRATNFDPVQLIRFPMRESNYVAIRLFFGILTPANVTGTLMALAAALGVVAAAPALWLQALIALGAFAATNVLFSRMLFAWVDRWLSTRRSRELFTSFILAISLAVQWANFTFNPAYNHHSTHAYSLSPQHLAWITHLLRSSAPVLAVLPPELAGSSLSAARLGHTLGFAGDTLADCAYGALFLLVFALRMRREFRGENLSETAFGVRPAKISPAKLRGGPTPAATQTLPSAALPAAARLRLLELVTTVLQKEILYARRNMGVLYGLLMPIFLVVIFASKFASVAQSPVWVFPAAVAYILLAVCPLSYNIFGLDGTGVQIFFLAPVRMRDVILAKNLLSVLTAAIEVILIFFLIAAMAGDPSPEIALATLLWAAGTLGVNLILGNQRSLASPWRIDPQRLARRQTSPLSALLSLAVLAVCAGLAVLLYAGCLWLHAMWALAPASALFAAAGMGAYAQTLRSMDGLALQHREELVQELCKLS